VHPSAPQIADRDNVIDSLAHQIDELRAQLVESRQATADTEQRLTDQEAESAKLRTRLQQTLTSLHEATQQLNGWVVGSRLSQQ
jgi:septal ring factor EnvC (AmiA/AmiB activator)